MGQFRDRVAVVTGGSSGMGRASALAFAREGARVVVAADKDVAGGEDVVRLIRESGGGAAFVKADVSRAADVEAMVGKVLELYGRLDYALNNAGVDGSHARVADCTEEQWERTIGINLKGVWLCMKSELAVMLKNGGGVIVNVASVAGIKPLVNNADYTASKYGIVGLSQAAALEYAGAGIRVNVICPGIIDTPMTRRTLLGPDKEPPGGLAGVVPLGRLGTSEDIAEAVVWLCSDAAAYVTGVALPVDGGLYFR